MWAHLIFIHLQKAFLSLQILFVPIKPITSSLTTYNSLWLQDKQADKAWGCGDNICVWESSFPVLSETESAIVEVGSNLKKRKSGPINNLTKKVFVKIRPFLICQFSLRLNFHEPVVWIFSCRPLKSGFLYLPGRCRHTHTCKI